MRNVAWNKRKPKSHSHIFPDRFSLAEPQLGYLRYNASLAVRTAKNDVEFDVRVERNGWNVQVCFIFLLFCMFQIKIFTTSSESAGGIQDQTDSYNRDRGATET